MALRLSTGMRNGLAGTSGLKEALDGGYIDIYTGGQPVNADYAETGVKIVRISTAAGTGGLLFGTSAAGVLPKSADIWSGTVGVAGLAGYFRFYGSGGTSGSSGTQVRMDGSVGVSNSDMVLANSSLVVGATLTIDTFTLTVPA
jgi:hypothetical protein